ncbi:hydroxyacid dehydrogenase [Botrimarina sp.]|uniref:hydroxyacid dehydrogenase n=1 Tax=Botrimarina sp. TaxID=2795802 RepID=UPI0032EFF021
MKVVIFELEEWERDHVQQLSDQHQVTALSEPLTAENAADHSDAEVVSTFIYSELTEEVIGKLQSLKLIATRSTGVDHIPIDACERRGVKVCNVPSYGSNTVAEHVFGLLLTISHKLDRAIDRTRKGDFSPRGLQGFDLRGKTMGVVGTGDIGRETIRIAKGFRMEVVAFDVKPDEAAADEMGFAYADMDDLLSRSDVVSLHVPSNEKTRHLISDEQFEKMKHGAVLINTSRGPLVDTKALLRALSEGKVAAAGLDVLPEEPVIREEAELLRSVFEERHNLDTLLADHVLVNMRNVVVTPHSAFNTREAVQRILDTTAENIRKFAEGEPQNLVA